MELGGFALEILLLLFLASLLAGFIDTLAGGGGLITLPALLAAGVPPLMALGTNKLQGTAGTATATLMMLRGGLIRLADVLPLMALSLSGALVGTLLVQRFRPELLSLVIPLVLLVIAIYFIFSPRLAKRLDDNAIPEPLFRRLIVPAIGFYDGMFGPGTGSFFSMASMHCRGLDLIRATALAKSLNLASNLGSLLAFLAFARIYWAAGLTMMLGQWLGAWLGSHTLLRIPQTLLRAAVVTICIVMLLRYFWTQFSV